MLTELDEVYEVLSCLPDPVFIISEEGEYVDFLGGTDTQSYHDGSALIGQTLHSVMPSEQADWYISQVITSLDNNQVMTVEYDLCVEDLNGIDPKSGPAGTLRFEGKIFPLSFTCKNQRVVCWLTRNISKRHRLELKLRKQSESDPLTQIANRRYFFSTLATITKSTTPHCLLLMDIDYFKKVNDTYGHLAGDNTLKEVVARIQDIIRPDDTFARVGGEEFALLLPDIEEHTAYEIAERIRCTIADTPFHYEQQTFSITLSVGVTQARYQERNNHIFSRADDALYIAKSRGRNQSMVLS
ncbi:GGDEF domain-containing protein [Vibrio mediterranei]|uniref:GGDEF domain-containing protein n=1 Tax=Vibrio mediterranei TaxID=689 RepID=UPI001EFC4989|nr:GGDEF domain-containing protein [Vibrio mediterranei]MCG9664043.1 GGDEF domain-containing protein [Vibrio mediterranei]